jgi:pyrimidine-specific ribonucleoside hydrolase
MKTIFIVSVTISIFLLSCTNSGIKENVEVIKNNQTTSGVNSYKENTCFANFPTDKKMFQEDIQLVMDTIIKLHGLEEWRMCIITNELHDHLGVYSIIRAKIGLKAREFSGVEIGRLKVMSLAGDKTPYSCLNDGIQVSTGATFGTNLISNQNIDKPEITAIFSYDNKKFKLSLKEEYFQKSETATKEIIKKYGSLTKNYWINIRKLGIKCWLEWNRNEIFDLEVLKQ